MKAIQEQTLGQILDNNRLARLLETSGAVSGNYTVDELLTDLGNEILVEIKKKSSVDVYRRNLQKIYLSKLISLLKPGKGMIQSIPVGVTSGYESRTVDLSLTDLPSVVRGHLEIIKTQLQQVQRVSDKISRYHYVDLLKRVEEALDPK